MKLVIFSFFAFAVNVSAAAAAPVVYSSFVDFNDALMGAPTTTFLFPAEDTANAPFIDFGAFQSTVSNPDMDTQHRVDGARLVIQVDPAPTGGGGLAPPPVDTRVTIEFDTPIYGLAFDELGADFIDVSIDGGTTFFDIFTSTGGVPFTTPGSGFFGIINDTNFDTIIFETDVGDAMLLESLIYTTVPLPPTPVPLPASALLLLSSVLGLAFSGRLRAVAK